MEKIEKKVLNGQRISVDECLTLAADADLYSLGFLADAVRKRLHPEPIVTYVIDRNINYTDICISACKFCAFFKTPDDKDGSLISFEELGGKIEETIKLNGTQILLQGGLHPDKPLEFYEEML
ncbi:MAG: dehypoxanthine futalosine cyclase, partial [Desulfobulbaceae bacterium]|nr:dehypoxanthine futalosine cyclase [Desulfobulbaceae bacterium]